MSVQGARDFEQRERKSVAGKLLPREHRELLRRAINESQFTDDSTSMRSLRARIESVRPEIKENELNAIATRKELLARIIEFKSSLSQKEVRDCRDPKLGRVYRLMLAINIGDAIYRAHMLKLGVPPSVTAHLRREKSMTLRWAYMLAHHTLQWLGDGGIEGASDKTLVNDVLDQDYVLTASFFTDVLSYEKDVREALADLNYMLGIPQKLLTY